MDINHYTPKYSGLKGRSFYSIKNFSPEDIFEILYTARLLKLKQNVGEKQTALAGKELLMVTKTEFTTSRISFEIAVRQLGGKLITLPLGGTHIEELICNEDYLSAIARCGIAGIIVNTEEKSDSKTLGFNAPFPVISAHGTLGPCVALAAVLTCWEKFGKLKDLPICIIGNITENNYIFQCAFKCGMRVSAVAPEKFLPTEADKAVAAIYAPVKCSTDISEGIKGCEAVFVAAGSDLGNEYFLTGGAMSMAAADAIFLHPMPVNRDTEADSAVCDGPNSAMLDMAENLLHIEKAVLALTLGKRIKE